MNNYELMVIIRADIGEEADQAVQEQVKQAISNQGGQIVEEDDMGKRRFAYEIDHMNEGHYIVYKLELDNQSVSAVERALRLNEQIIRHLIVRDEEVLQEETSAE